MSTEASWLSDPSAMHDLRYWDGAAWTEHVIDAGAQSVDPPPPGLPAPLAAPAAPPPPPPPAAASPPDAPPAPAAQQPTGKLSWKDRLKQAAEQGKAVAEQAKGAVAEQQSKRAQQWAEDPNTIWWGESKGAGTSATGMSKARYRITKDRISIDTGLLGVRSEQVPLWAVKDIDVRQSLLYRGQDVGDVILQLEDPAYGVDPSGAMSMSGMTEAGTTSGEVLLDNIEGPYRVQELLMPLVSEARAKKLRERQTQYLNVNPGYGAAMAGMAAPAPAAPPPPAGPPADLSDQLRKLAALRDDGVLSEEEFAAQKARLLSG